MVNRGVTAYWVCICLGASWQPQVVQMAACMVGSGMLWLCLAVHMCAHAAHRSMALHGSVHSGCGSGRRAWLVLGTCPDLACPLDCASLELWSCGCGACGSPGPVDVWSCSRSSGAVAESMLLPLDLWSCSGRAVRWAASTAHSSALGTGRADGPGAVCCAHFKAHGGRCIMVSHDRPGAHAGTCKSAQMPGHAVGGVMPGSCKHAHCSS